MLQATKPAEAIKMRNEYIAAALHDRFVRSGDDSWQQQLAKTASPVLLPHLLGGAQQPPPVQ